MYRDIILDEVYLDFVDAQSIVKCNLADCLETIVEIGTEYQQLFTQNGGEKVQLVESLNDHPLWIETLKDLVVVS